MLTEIHQTQIAAMNAAFENENVRPLSVTCDDAQLGVKLADGRVVCTPLWWYPKLLSATPDARANVQLMFDGFHWPDIDEDISVKSMLLGWRAPGAIDPDAKSAEAAASLGYLSAGRPLPKDWEKSEYFVEGAACTLDYRSRIHDRIDLTWEGGRRFRPEFDYDRFYAATDTLLDVANILHAAANSIWPRDVCAGQLWMYGAMQALAVQQSAAKQLLTCFDITKFSIGSDVLAEVNELRIAAVGHPANHDSKRLSVKGCTFLSHREHGSRTKFKLVSLRNFNKSVYRTIDVPELIARQKQAIEMNLAIVWRLIKDDPSFDRPD